MGTSTQSMGLCPFRQSRLRGTGSGERADSIRRLGDQRLAWRSGRTIGGGMEGAIVGAIGVGIGALIAVLGGLATERQRQRGDHRRWALEQRMILYSTLLDASRRARDNAYAVSAGFGRMADEPRKTFRATATRAQLVASQQVIREISRLGEYIHDDMMAARWAASSERGERPELCVRCDRRHERITDYAAWHERRDAMHNAFRADLGLEPVQMEHRAVRAGPGDSAEPQPDSSGHAAS